MPSETCWCGHTLEEHHDEIRFCKSLETVATQDITGRVEHETFLCPCSMFIPAHDHLEETG